MDKKIFEMYEGIPIWKHLLNKGRESKTNLKASDYGKLSEWVGKREIKKLIKHGFIADIFPGLNVLGMHRIIKKTHNSKEYGDYTIEISYSDHDKIGKKILIVEIKHGHIHIDQKQIHRYSSMILTPEAYFRKADEVKVIFMLFTNINTSNATATYSLSELDKNFAYKIVDAIPKDMQCSETEGNIFSILENG